MTAGISPLDPLKKLAEVIVSADDKTEITAQILNNLVEFKQDLKEFKGAVVDMSKNIKELNSA
ncbi:MAG: hypothetical protein GWP10_10045, partial [Nitrospiraceae bacterium]|nr:hypothetical protein [Nitrospiraceae bacterium]